MALSSKEYRILALLVIDTVFFLLEIIIGCMVNSLALIADSFHMLNDIISLMVAFWAVNVAKTRSADGEYTYGWLRAEILGALINAVFLIALCFTIFIEAVQRLLDPPVITNPKLILIVGTCGLISNIVGLFLFHEHGHSHGGSVGGGHSHSHGAHDEENLLDNEDIENDHDHSHDHSHEHSHEQSHEENHPPKKRSKSIYSKHATQLNDQENTPLLDSTMTGSEDLRQVMPQYVVDQLDSTDKKRKKNSHNTNQKSLNMQGVFLHVLGDALGNIGVMLTAIFIWKTDYSWKYYFDPFISLVITCIIFSSALPLCKRSSRILLQGTPSSIETSDVVKDILEIPSVLNVHDFHIWNLTEHVLIASLHADLSCSPDNFLNVASEIKLCLHDYGIHSATIQPEFSSFYAKQRVLPHTYSSQNLSQEHNNSSHSNNNLPSNSNENSNGSTSATFNISNTNDQSLPTSSIHRKPSHDIHCLIDATANCTTADCLT